VIEREEKERRKSITEGKERRKSTHDLAAVIINKK
jgi:hypothetical protein